MFNCFLAEQRKYGPVTTVCQQGGRVAKFFVNVYKGKRYLLDNDLNLRKTKN